METKCRTPSHTSQIKKNVDIIGGMNPTNPTACPSCLPNGIRKFSCMNRKRIRQHGIRPLLTNIADQSRMRRHIPQLAVFLENEPGTDQCATFPDRCSSYREAGSAVSCYGYRLEPEGARAESPREQRCSHQREASQACAHYWCFHIRHNGALLKRPA